ncbi:EscU/YscU/HrcU family type III secretion system export apparatus switch protein [Gimesia maris]|uniref:ABC transporter permease n=1 Tax=Gimesia maris TaxID=122 RepID=A0ABX5YVF1_9PLAN|nr:EscU/YscU/HrcU family type III secretion system export apparatus switch protein [Gimesia maris]QEG19784.1 hypothetical protein GmarT_56910 [Gimesia maris]QGQ27397.1 EscU/YscU/HrcU family type III secretion system export apparatus switch protein [Gimesia maris]
MSSAFLMTTRNFCKRARLGASLAVGALVLCPLVSRIIMQVQGLRFEHLEQNVFDYHFAYLGVSYIFFIGVCLQALTGSEKFCLGLPVSSTSIATWMMLSMVGLVVALQLVTNGLYRVLFFDDRWLADYWPLLGPLLFMVTLILVGHAVYWSLHAPSLTKCIFWSAVVVALFWWFISRYFPNGYNEEIVPWRTVTLGEFILMQSLGVAAWYQGTRAFAHVRNGTALPSPQWEQLQVWWKGLLTGSIPEQPIVPLSRKAALARLHWRDSCQRAALLAGVGFGLTMLVINVLVIANFDPSRTNQNNFSQLVEVFFISSMFFGLVAAIIVAVLMGEGTTGSGRTEMKQFLAKAPLVDRDLNSTLFRNLLKTLGLTFMGIVVALTLSLIIAGIWHGAEVFQVLLSPVIRGGSSILPVFLLVIGFWVIAANMISVFWTGRSWFYFMAIGVFFGGIVFYIILMNLGDTLFRNSMLYHYMTIVLLLLPPLLICAGTFAAYMVACRRKLISQTGSIVALVLWMCSVTGVLIWMLERSQYYHGVVWGLLLIYATLAALVLAPFATIPLALSWNRHR